MCEGCVSWVSDCVEVQRVHKFNEATGGLFPFSLPTHYHGYCEDGRREVMELGLIVIPLGDGVDEITESRYQGNCQQHLEGNTHMNVVCVCVCVCVCVGGGGGGGGWGGGGVDSISM